MHPYMIFDIGECEQLSSLPRKTTVVTATSQAPVDFLMWSVFSFLLRSEPNGFLEHINVVINGADSRTGDPSVQDKKQKFLEELRSLKWRNLDKTQIKDMPVTVIRVWSRIGADQATEMGITWVHTDSYTIAHDDIIALPGWDAKAQTLYDNDNIAILHDRRTKLTQFNSTQYEGKNKLGFPHMNAHFLVCRKAAIAQLGTRWAGYHFQSNFFIPEEVFNNNKLNPALKNVEYSYINQDFGAWVCHKIKSLGYTTETVDELAFHFGGMSWGNLKNVNLAKQVGKQHIKKLEQELQQYPEYWAVYQKYKSCE